MNYFSFTKNFAIFDFGKYCVNIINLKHKNYMKKNLFLIGIALMAIFAVSCSKNSDPTPVPVPVGDEVQVLVRLNLPDGFLFQEEDKAAINGEVVAIPEEFAGKQTAEFFVILEDKAALKNIRFAYPAGLQTGLDSAKIPAQQSFVASGVADQSAAFFFGLEDAKLLIELEPEPEPEPELTVKDAPIEPEPEEYGVIVNLAPACSIVNLPVSSEQGATLKTLTISANNENEILSGNLQVLAGSAGLVSKMVSGTNSVVVDFGEGLMLTTEPINVSVVLPLGTLTEGLEVLATDVEGTVAVPYVENEPVVVEAGLVAELNPMEYVVAPKGPVTLNVTIGGEQLTWAEGDAVVVNGELSSEVAPEAVGTSTASFALTNVAYPYTVFYPADLYSVPTSVRLYNKQTFGDGFVDRSALAMVGYTTGTDVTLNNLCGVITFDIVNARADENITINKVRIETADNTPLCGRFNLNYKKGTITPSAPNNVLTLENDPSLAPVVVAADGGRITLNAVVPAGEYPAGISVTLVTKDGEEVYDLLPKRTTLAKGAVIAGKNFEFSELHIDAITTPKIFVNFMKKAAAGNIENFLNEKGEVALGADLDLTDVDYTEVPTFSGIFNFEGYTIKGLKSYLFKELKGTVKNIKLEDINAPLFETLSEGAKFDGVMTFVTPLTQPLALNVDAEVSGIVLENATLSAPLFYRVTANGAVKNVELTSTVTFDLPVPTGETHFGGVVGKNEGLVEKCKSAAQYDGQVATLPGASVNVGGIVGYSTGLVKDCEHSGSFKLYIPAPTKATYHTLGGVVGLAQAASGEVAVTGCTNTGEVYVKYKTAVYYMVGGVVGGTPSAKNCPGDYGVLENLTNRGNVGIGYGDGGSGAYPCIGGVVAYVEGKLKGCNNYGTLDQKCDSATATWTCTRLGGVAGAVTRGAEDCHNFGTFTVDALCAGGTAGARNAANAELSTWAGCIGCAGPYVPDNTVIFKNCTNAANLTATPGSTTRTPHHCFGGVFGFLSACAEDCENTGTYNIVCNVATQNIGGIAGCADALIKNCVNSGDIILDSSDASYTSWMVRMGGMAGWAARTVNTEIIGCTNKGNLSVNGGNAGSSRDVFIGGIFGSCGNATLASGAASTNKKCTTDECSNSGTLSFTDGLRGHTGDMSGLYEE